MNGGDRGGKTGVESVDDVRAHACVLHSSILAIIQPGRRKRRRQRLSQSNEVGNVATTTSQGLVGKMVERFLGAFVRVLDTA